MKGVTVVEVMIILAICAILVAIAVPAFQTGASPQVQDPNVRCIDGYKFILQQGVPVQMFGSGGGGISCWK